MKNYYPNYFASVLMVLIILNGQTSAKLTQQELVELTDQAGGLFRQANDLAKSEPGLARTLYEQTILRYKKIIEEGHITNAPLYYNIGNAYLLMGDVGRAILNYRRAQQFAGEASEPAGNLRKNLQTALEQRRDEVQLKTQKRILQTLFFWYYDFSIKTRLLLGCFAWVSAWVLLSVYIWRRRGRGAVGTAIVGMVVAVCFAVSVAVDVNSDRTNAQGVIVADEVTARQGDGINYPESFVEPLHCGTEFILREKRSKWLRIELTSGDDTWIPAETAEMI
ncbi:MAG: tetratricopeptide repeat protein [Sedimentisphaerales bacterium]|nr:tetratricopeptide repeat protein [Sedimentisphaerales bacterium]